MPPVYEYFRSVEDVWVICIIASMLLVVGVYRGFSSGAWRNWKQFADDEKGSSYAIPYVMTFPIYLMIVCLIIQASMILIVKMGTVYSAYASARSAIVWQSAGEHGENIAQVKARRAAVAAIAPFASSDRRHAKKFGVIATPDAYIYHSAYQRAAEENVKQDPGRATPAVHDPSKIASQSYVVSKYAFADRATSVQIPKYSSPWNEDVHVIVQYEMPMSVPGAGRIMGRWWNTDRFYSRIIESRAVMPSETPATESGQIGIGYDPSKL